MRGEIKEQMKAFSLLLLTNLTPPRSNAVVEAEVVDLAVAVFYIQHGEAKVDPLATRHADLPLTHCVVRVCPRVTQRGQSPAAGAKHTGAAAITCRTTQTNIRRLRSAGRSFVIDNKCYLKTKTYNEVVQISNIAGLKKPDGVFVCYTDLHCGPRTI